MKRVEARSREERGPKVLEGGEVEDQEEVG